MAKILIVDDDLVAADSVRERLAEDAHVVEVAGTGEDALQLCKNFEYDLLLLDWTLPGISGLEVCREYRRAGGVAWVIFITGRGDLESKEDGLDTGADDYMVKPFQLRELAARVRRALRRGESTINTELKIGNVALDLTTSNLIVGEQFVRLRPKESALLEYLMRNPKKMTNAKGLLAAVWPSDTEASEGTVRSFMLTLRQKLESLGQGDLVKTVAGHGYTIEG